jgi:hypothetical protein
MELLRIILLLQVHFAPILVQSNVRPLLLVTSVYSTISEYIGLKYTLLENLQTNFHPGLVFLVFFFIIFGL